MEYVGPSDSYMNSCAAAQERCVRAAVSGRQDLLAAGRFTVNWLGPSSVCVDTIFLEKIREHIFYEIIWLKSQKLLIVQVIDFRINFWRWTGQSLFFPDRSFAIWQSCVVSQFCLRLL